MPSIITRYLLLEIVKSSAATLLVLFTILMSNALGRVLAEIADGDTPQQALWPVLVSQSVNIFSLLLPIAIFLGIIFAFGRLYKDHEIVVMNACGMGYWQFYKPVFILLVPAIMISAYCSIWLNAEMQRQAQKIVEQQEDIHEFEQIRPGQFNQSNKGEHVFFMESISEDRRILSDILISESSKEKLVMETAEKGRYQTDENTGDLFLVVGPGVRFEGQAGEAGFREIEFEEHGILIENKTQKKKKSIRPEEKRPAELKYSKRLQDQAEYYWRLAIPIVLVVLSLLAVPLAYIAPRQGRYGKVGVALLVYVVYLNLMALSKGKIEDGSLPLDVNFWWVHALFVLFALILLKNKTGFRFFSPRVPVS